MTTRLWVRSHVERLLQDEWGVCRVTTDAEGDYPFRRGTAAAWVTVLDMPAAPMVRVWAHAAHDVKATLAVWRELNEIQDRAVSCAVSWGDGSVVVSQTVSALGLTQPVLAQALDAVAGMADDIGMLVAGMFGGTTPFPVEEPIDKQAS